MLTAQEVGARMGIAEASVRRLAAKRGVGQKHGKAWAFSEEDVQALELAHGEDTMFWQCGGCGAKIRVAVPAGKRGVEPVWLCPLCGSRG